MNVDGEFGPLEYAGGLWVVGDPDRAHVRLTPRGISHWADGAETVELRWPRFMSFGLETQVSRRGDSKRLIRVAKIAANLAGAVYVGSQGSRAAAMLRHPYEEWSADFDHHVRKYTRREITMADALLRHTIAAGKGERLGDPAWVAAAVSAMRGVPSARRARAAVESMLRAG
ncbi:hypothetical protein [Actinacidiphila acidipaludis]|uniref:Uncharacterized protein n=1 Tax=Actinacidiphila acidipaludis TaxID=2873382 RepID=A0ABS7Q1H4_9ACTN|nr:hypothetical protein [Streptomyces acidipaludis]MBY8876300.1 hypothetical protein [Streptomyces acidipaludis]